jgi:hypothetical protein
VQSRPRDILADDDLIAHWDPARRRPHRYGPRDDPERDEWHDDFDPPADETHEEAEHDLDPSLVSARPRGWASEPTVLAAR